MYVASSAVYMLLEMIWQEVIILSNNFKHSKVDTYSWRPHSFIVSSESESSLSDVFYDTVKTF